jgi:hypothetical protein
MFNDVRKGMDIQIVPETSGISLSRYAKRNDPIGVKARNEIERRQRMKAMKKPVRKPKAIKEETTTVEETDDLMSRVFRRLQSR